MEIKKLEPLDVADFRDLIEIFKDVFENDKDVPTSEYLGGLLSNPDFIVFVVKLDGKVVGGLTIYVLHGYYSEQPTAYLYDVGISPKHQGKGLGKALMAEVCRYCQQNNFEEAYVEAESDDIDAVGFYRKTKYSREMNATHFSYFFGKD